MKTRKVDKEKVLELSKSITSIDPMTIKFLVSRGVETVEEINKFFNYGVVDIPTMSSFKDGEKALKAIKHSIENKEKIAVYGDYDMDGIAATSIVLNTLKNLGVECDFYINDRKKEGFGLRESGINKLINKINFDLLITVDNGVDRVKEAEYLKKLGKKLIITDHHLPLNDGSIPSCEAVLNAHRLDEEYYFKEMCGAGMAFLLMLNLYTEVKNVSVSEALHTDLFRGNIIAAGVATVADVVELKDFNHFVVKKSLETLNDHPTKNWELFTKELFTKLAKNNSKKIFTEYDYGFYIAPTFNSVGRMKADLTPAVEILTEDSEDKIIERTKEVILINESRKEQKVKDIERADLELTVNNWKDKPYILVYGDYHEGLAGIVAGELKEKYKKPAFVLCVSEADPTILKGSARSVPGIHLKELLDDCAVALSEYGGHAGAAGLSLKKENINQFMSLLDEKFPLASEGVVEDEVDFILIPKQLKTEMIKNLYLLRPFGMGFEAPTFCIRGCIPYSSVLCERDYRMIKKDRTVTDHIKFKIDNYLQCLCWNQFKKFDEFVRETDQGEGYVPVELLGEPELNTFNGKTDLQLKFNKYGTWNPQEYGLKVKNDSGIISYQKV